MSKVAFVRARIEPELKMEAEHILETLGITPSQAINMLYKAIKREKSFPVELKIPNAKTRRILRESEKGIGLIKSKNFEDFAKKMGEL